MEQDDSRLKQIVADLTLDKQMLQGIKKALRLKQLKQLAAGLINDYRISITRACSVVCFHRSAWHYKSTRREDRQLRQQIKEIAAARVRYGIWRIYVLLRQEGSKDNNTRVYCIYKEDSFNYSG